MRVRWISEARRDRVSANAPAMALGAVAVALLASLSPATAFSADDGLKVVIIRHGEKPETGDNLSCQGENRALALPAVLSKKFGKPDYTYVPAMNLSKSSTHARMFQTVTPFAVKQNLTVNSRYAEGDVASVAKDVLKRTGLVLLVWDHSQIPPLAKALGVNHPPSWGDDDFDSIWIITHASGHASMSVDTQGITPSSQCNY
jgi:hypothetical protein